MQRVNVIADGGKHATHLMITPLGERQPHASVAEYLQCYGFERLSLGFQHHRAAGEHVRFITTQCIGQCGFVNLWQMCFVLRHAVV